MTNREFVKVKQDIFSNSIRKIEILLLKAKELLSERNFIYLASVLVAISCAIAVMILKLFSHFVFVFSNNVNSYLKLPYINSILPIVGIILTVLFVKKFLDGNIEKGTSKVLYAVARKRGIIPKKQMYAQIVTSSLTVGLGGSAGLESPIVITGAAFGSNFAQHYHLSQKNRILLLACGVAAGISTAFNAPIAGVLFAIEVVLTDVSIVAFIPIMISAATGTLISEIFLKEAVLLNFARKEFFNFYNMPYYIILGVLSGFVSIYHVRTFRKVESYFHTFSKNIYTKAIFGSLLLAILIFLFPPLFGEGYESIKTLSTAYPGKILENTILKGQIDNSWVLLLFIGIITFIKAIATGITLGSGGNGGNFAPSLFVGSYLGFFLAKTISLLGISPNIPVANFTIVGMAGILSGLFHAPLTAIFLIAEITGGYQLMVPLLVVSSISFAISKKHEKHSMDVKNLADKGEVFTDDKDKNILQSIDLKKEIDCAIVCLKTENPSKEKLESFIPLLATTNQVFYPVIAPNNLFLGMVELKTIKQFLQNPYSIKYTTIAEVITIPNIVVKFEDTTEIVFEKFETSQQTTLVVIKKQEFYGTISKLTLLEKYRDKLKDLVIE